MSVVQDAVDVSSKKSIDENVQVAWSRGTRILLLFAAGVVLAAALTSAVVVTTSVLHVRDSHQDGFVRYEHLDTPHAASVGVLDFKEEGSALGHEEIYINDVTKEQTIQLYHPYYDIFTVKKYNEGREMILVTTRPEHDQQRRVVECEEKNMTETEFVSSSMLLSNSLIQPPEVAITKRFKETTEPIKLAFRSCDQIPSEMYKEQESSELLPEESGRKKRRGVRAKYGNWGGRWNYGYAAFPSCCPGCKYRQQCTSMNCAPPLDALDQASMDYTFCTQCWRQTPTQEIPHCDCIRDFMNDLNTLRCPHDNYESCYRYRGSMKGIMSSHTCWGRLVTKTYEVRRCGFKQTRCHAGKCQIKPLICVKGRTIVKNNFKCQSYLTCSESIRQLSGGSPALMTYNSGY